jgi:hypothetical protein
MLRTGVPGEALPFLPGPPVSELGKTVHEPSERGGYRTLENLVVDGVEKGDPRSETVVRSRLGASPRRTSAPGLGGERTAVSSPPRISDSISKRAMSELRWGPRMTDSSFDPDEIP